MKPSGVRSYVVQYRNRKTGASKRMWQESRPAPGTPAESYLRHRGVNIPVPESIRYNPSVKHTDTGLLLPCMVAAVQAMG